MVSGGFVQKTSNIAHENISVDTKNAIPLKISYARTEMANDGLVKKLQNTKNASPLKTFPKCVAHFNCGEVSAKLKTATTKREPRPNLKKRGRPFKKRVNRKGIVTKFNEIQSSNSKRNHRGT